MRPAAAVPNVTGLTEGGQNLANTVATRLRTDIVSGRRPPAANCRSTNLKMISG